MTARLAALALLWWCLSTPHGTDAPALRGPFADAGGCETWRADHVATLLTTRCWWWDGERAI